ncbi:hypothetical protein [Sphingomonas kyeonggiensis]|uniref:Uncharacterized protein n=1 Tax=Sphingomonas kyeonggiensis TaxID=1268553 RepID=A0A7W6JNB7_9SPHN|nr:hypothetical protein [Sphingomonas kyeonggiensis]MBB4096558.1 hypothetical protein [Sphingomonas kyeonggiensis]
MPNTRFVEILGQGHGTMFNRCSGMLAMAFPHDPAAPLDLDCTTKATGPIFRE